MYEMTVCDIDVLSSVPAVHASLVVLVSGHSVSSAVLRAV